MSATMEHEPRHLNAFSFDVEMIRCCDDEYIVTDDPEQPVEQPSDRPSLLAYFVWTLKLVQIQGLALRTLVCCHAFRYKTYLTIPAQYASTKAKAHFKFQGEEWLARTVVHFDSLLNSWFDSIPDHRMSM